MIIVTITNIHFILNYFYSIEKFKYILNVADKVGTMRINKRIGNSVDAKGNITYGINGADFTAEFDHLQNTCSSITVLINSIGGNVIEGYQIASSILNSKVPVTTIVEGVAASTAGWIAACGSTRKINDYASVMAHNSTGGNKEMCEFINNSINTILVGRSGKTTEEITAIMNAETWMNADKAIENGFIDEKISTGKKIKTPKNASAEQLENIYNELINPKKNMSKINTLLKIGNSADESEQEAAIVALNNELSTTKAELEALKVANAAKETADKVALKTKATEMVNAAKTAGKVKAEDVEETIENASKDQKSFDFVSKMLAVAPSSKTATHIFNPQNVAKTGTDGREDWTHLDWQKKDPKGLEKMTNETPDIAEALYNATYKK